MRTISIQLDDTKATLLQEKAEHHGLSLEQLVRAAIEDLLAQPETDVEAAMQRVLAKNEDLYKRLA
ncbi:MAG: hypothetical protein GFH27_549289n135 [Chloroflexi bacterium AL-W]|nr:hypothetical protein [Chloroflexi bacterium AL-N1]NOK66867.1 hypothetical protein [Chloroflexi bacterium AL-N10]NOK74841.1 hypothetical protein [Chloroflexi bacterium AL-N5]NOK81470.1 hypothetical protein [Chloroflexi bacterium AL-W]NOK88939.1 hypothetical protein [Chloroflexi bacterium AL-N15]